MLSVIIFIYLEGYIVRKTDPYLNYKRNMETVLGNLIFDEFVVAKISMVCSYYAAWALHGNFRRCDVLWIFLQRVVLNFVLLCFLFLKI